jgi:hypothetical protein
METAGANKSAKERSPWVKKHEDSTRRVTVGERTTAVRNREIAVTAREEIAKRREGHGHLRGGRDTRRRRGFFWSSVFDAAPGINSGLPVSKPS